MPLNEDGKEIRKVENPNVRNIVGIGIHRAISEWLTDPIGAEIRLKRYLTETYELAKETKQVSSMVSLITTALRFGPGEVSKMEIEHMGRVLEEQRVLILPATASIEDWTRQHRQIKTSSDTEN